MSGLGETVLDRALADSDWLAQRLDDLVGKGPLRAKAWSESPSAFSTLLVERGRRASMTTARISKPVTFVLGAAFYAPPATRSTAPLT